MELYSGNEHYKLYKGNMLDMLDDIKENSIDAVITDPPYEIGFMGKSWDSSGVAFQKETWGKCFKALKEGGYLLAFGGSKTFHRIACAIEDAGFEIRDTIMWLYSSGFPKGINIGLAVDKKKGIDNTTGNIRIDGKATNSGSGCWNCNDGKCNSMKPQFAEREAQNQWKGYNSALKPSFEPIIIARKPFSGTLVDNVLKNGVGGINIDECRVGIEERTYKGCGKSSVGFIGGAFENGSNEDVEYSVNGRYPANTILTYNDETFDEVCGGLPNTKSGSRHNTCERKDTPTSYGYQTNTRNEFSDEGSAARYYKNCPYEDSDIWDYLEDIEIKRYFYSGKASKRDRDEGLKDFNESQGHSKGNGLDRVCEFCGVSQLTPELCHCEVKSWVAKPRKNVHPSVKPCSLMAYLVRLVTPKGGTILDPFNGSGSTGKAVMRENKERNANYKYIGIEMTDEYLPISKARIEFEIPNCEIRDFNNSSNEIETKVKESQTSIGNKQISIFD